MALRGELIEESLIDATVLAELRIIGTRVEPVTAEHQTPWCSQWTVHMIEVDAEDADALARRLSLLLQPNHWYVDFSDETTHYVVFPSTVFRIDRHRPEEYKAAVSHGLTLRIPRHQLDFSPDIAAWQRPSS